MPYLSVEPMLIGGIAAAIRQLKYDMLLYSCLDERPPDTIASTLLDGRTDAIVIEDRGIDMAGMQALAKAKMPTVVLYTQNVADGIGYVGVDNRAGVWAAVDHLVDLGHRHVAYYGNRATFDFIERSEACRDRLAYYGITMAPAANIVGSDWKPDAGRACDIIRGLTPRPTAVIAGNDVIAYEMICAFRERAVRVPEDISVVGFDGVAMMNAAPITTIKTDPFELARTAIFHVKDIIDGKPANECRTVMPVEFVPSASTGPAPV
jgi:LacI family transcriptional regulator